MRIIGHPAIKLINKIERGVYTNPIRTFVLLMRGALPATLEQCGCCRGPRRLVGGPCSRTNHMLNLYIYIYIYHTHRVRSPFVLAEGVQHFAASAIHTFSRTSSIAKMISESFAEAVAAFGVTDAVSGQESSDHIQSKFHEIISKEIKQNGEPNTDSEPERIAPTTEALAFQSVIDSGGKLDMKSTMGNLLWTAVARYKSGALA